MHLNHVHLTVGDVGATVALLETSCGFRRTRLVTGDRAYLRDDGDALIPLFRGEDAVSPEMFHSGFSREPRQECPPG